MDIAYKQLSVNTLKVRNINKIISAIIFTVIFSILLFCTKQFHWWNWLQYVWIGIIVLNILSVPWKYFISSPIYYKTFRYGLTDDFLYIKSGIWFHSEVVVPLAKIQSIELTQGSVMRKYGVSSVEVTTMKGHHDIPHIEDDVAKKLRDDISKLARLKELDD